MNVCIGCERKQGPDVSDVYHVIAVVDGALVTMCGSCALPYRQQQADEMRNSKIVWLAPNTKPGAKEQV